MTTENAMNEAPACPVCPTGYGMLLGTLGTLDHFRCRCCGWDWNAPHEDTDEDEPS